MQLEKELDEVAKLKIWDYKWGDANMMKDGKCTRKRAAGGREEEEFEIMERERVGVLYSVRDSNKFIS